MSDRTEQKFFEELYKVFSRPISEIDCGKKCGPHHDYGVPVCCDIHLIVPAAYLAEWEYLKDQTDLWQPWSSSGPVDQDLEDEVENGQVLLKCQGYQRCQRPFRTLTCRAFPFFPYLNSQGDFIGLAYFEEYRDFCWIISNLSVVSSEFLTEFKKAYELVFQQYPESQENYARYAAYLRDEMADSGAKIIQLDFGGNVFSVDPVSEISTQLDFEELDSFGPFTITRELPFPDEQQD
jgi:hypothetical protein